jgi:hypothetical protein
MALARAWGSRKVLLRSASKQGTNTAAPTPCRTRPAIKVPSPGAIPQIAEAKVKMTNPAMRPGGRELVPFPSVDVTSARFAQRD